MEKMGISKNRSNNNKNKEWEMNMILFGKIDVNVGSATAIEAE